MKLTFFFNILISLLFFIQCEKDPTGIKPVKFTWFTSTPEQQAFNKQIINSAVSHVEHEGFIDGLPVLRNDF